MATLTHVYIHEAGHMLACIKLSVPTYGYTVGQDERGSYACALYSSTSMSNHKLIAAGGAAAELVVLGQISSSFAALASDLESGFTSWADFEATARKVASWLSQEEVLSEAARASLALAA